MKRDMALILKILRCLCRKDDDSDEGFTPPPHFEPTYSDGRVAYHLTLCEHAGYVERRAPTAPSLPPTWRLTWQGHEFLESKADR